MAKVYDTPRYKDQALDKFKVIISHSELGMPSSLNISGKERRRILAAVRYRDIDLDYYDLDHINMNSYSTREDVPDILKYAYREKIKRDQWNRQALVSIGTILAKDVGSLKITSILNDDKAMYEFIIDIICGRLVITDHSSKVIPDVVEKLAKDATFIAAVGNYGGLGKSAKTVIGMETFDKARE